MSSPKNTSNAPRSQQPPKFDWPALRKAIALYESEGLRYLPAGWGHKNPSVKWEQFQRRAPTIEEKAAWFHEGKPTNIGALLGAASRGIIALCFNHANGAIDFFSKELWQNLLSCTFITKSVRGVHVYLRSSTPIKSQIVRKDSNDSWLEIRSDGNFTVLPPSLHPTGVLYEAIGVKHVASPKNLITYIEQRLSQLGLKARLAQRGAVELKRAARERPDHSEELNQLGVEKLLETCSFIQHCRDSATTLSEPRWWSMCDILSFFGEPGKEKAHELSKPYPKYTREETNQKLEYAKKAVDKDVGPHTCAYIEQDLSFDCPADCLAKKWNLKSPVVLASKLARTAGLPIIVVTNRFLREKTADTIAAVGKANMPPQIFERSGNIVRISNNEFGSPYIETLTESACRGFIERAANYVKVNKKGEMAPLSAPPLDIVRDFISLPKRNLPALLGVTEVPVLRSDGTIVTEPGYDERSKLYYQPAAGLIIPTVPDNPSQRELDAAVALIQEPIIDFPFDTEASRTNALALMVTPVYRPMITGLVPLCVIDKPQPGTGAGLLSDVIATIATGRPVAMMAPPKTDEECEKRLTSILRHGRSIIAIDNIDGYLYFPSLAMILTTTTVQTRILGQSEEVLLPNRATYIVTGNNVRLAGDLPRRCYLSRMDARAARPWMRDPKSFKYQHLIQWVKENRGELLAAILTIARAWIAAGRPLTPGLPPMGGFEEWTNIVGSILAYAGIRGFLGNLDFMYSQSDVETPQWEAFLESWHDIIGEEPVTSAELITHIKENLDLRATLPDAIGDTEAKNYSVKVGQNLGKRNGVRYPGGLELKKAGTSHRAITWKVVRVDDATSPQFSYESEVGEVDSILTQEGNNNDKKTYKDELTLTSPTSPLAIKQGEVAPGNNPPYPTHPCHNCRCGDYWLREVSAWGEAEWLCSRCHPKPGGGNSQ